MQSIGSKLLDLDYQKGWVEDEVEITRYRDFASSIYKMGFNAAIRQMVQYIQERSLQEG